jgi:hypothetical protein
VLSQHALTAIEANVPLFITRASEWEVPVIDIRTRTDTGNCYNLLVVLSSTSVMHEYRALASSMHACMQLSTCT